MFHWCNNQANVQGASLKPPPLSTFVTGAGQTTNATQTLYTVPSGFDLWLTRFFMNIRAIAAGNGYLGIYNASSALQVYVAFMGLDAGTHGEDSGNLIPPILAPTGYTVRIFSSAVDLQVTGGIIGYIFDNA